MWTINERYSFKTLEPSVLAGNETSIARLKETPMPRSVWLHGAVGVAKTHLAKCALNRHLYRGYSVDVIVGPEFRVIGEQFPQDREDDQRRYIAPDLLLIDDIDKLELTGKALESLWYILNCRFMAGKRNIITSQLEAREMAKQWRAVRNINQPMLESALDRFNPCVQFRIAGEKSLRHTHAPKPAQRPRPQDVVSAEDAARIRAAGTNLAALGRLKAGISGCVARGATNGNEVVSTHQTSPKIDSGASCETPQRAKGVA